MSAPLTATVTHTVTEADTARALGSGGLAVLGTPRLLAWAEEATCAVLAESLAESESSVGTRVQLEHLVASPVGQRVELAATVVHQDGRLRRFEVVASHPDDGRTVAHSEITRVVVDVQRFLRRL